MNAKGCEKGDAFCVSALDPLDVAGRKMLERERERRPTWLGIMASLGTGNMIWSVYACYFRPVLFLRFGDFQEIPGLDRIVGNSSFYLLI